MTLCHVRVYLGDVAVGAESVSVNIRSEEYERNVRPLSLEVDCDRMDGVEWKFGGSYTNMSHHAMPTAWYVFTMRFGELTVEIG